MDRDRDVDPREPSLSTVPYPRAGEIREPIASVERQRVRRALRNTAAMAVLLHTTSLMCLFTLRKFNWP